MNKAKKWLLFVGVGLMMLGMIPMSARAEQIGTFLDRPIFDNEFGRIELEKAEEDALQKYGAVYPAKYDPRTLGMISAVEDQGQTNTCWAFAAISAMECNLIKKGYANSSINLSENHLAYFFYNLSTDPMGSTSGDGNVATRSSWYMNGGSSTAAALHLATWSGVVNEVTPENDSAGAYTPKTLPANACFRRDYVLESVYFYDYNVNTVKEAITKYGAVSSGIGMFSEYLSSNQEAYYCPVEEANHAVTIVGWDDNYSRNNFRGSNRPKGDGAWIVKNSYGTSIHDGGYVYVSYYDASLCEIVAYDMGTPATSGNNNYQHDGNAGPYNLDFKKGLTFANVFKVKGSSQKYNETLDAVSVNVWTPNVSYTLQVYTGVTGTSKPTNGKLVMTQKGTLSEIGYCRINLDKPVTLTAGEKYSVVMKFTSAKGGVSLGVESYGMAGDWLKFRVGTKKGAGYVKTSSGKWYDCGNASHMRSFGTSTFNIRIKAFTTTTNQKTSYKLSDSKMGISKGSTGKLSLKINPTSVKRKVTWNSSNKNVVTVSSSGKLKAKAYGTATVTAKFVAGSKTKTLKCKVSVGPSKVKNFKAKSGKGKLTLSWSVNSAASGYEIYYSKSKTGGYKLLTTVKSGRTVKYSKKLTAGTYYVKMRPYLKQGNQKLCGSYTSVKAVTVK